jgi:hypothetical protein
MADPYVLRLHPELAAERKALETAAAQDPTGRDAKLFNALEDGLDALAEGREAEFDGKRMHSIQDRYGELGDHAEIKIEVDEEYAPNGYKFGASHRLTYQEAEGTTEDPRPVRRAIAFEPRKDGQPFVVSGQRNERALSVGLDELDQAKAAEATGGNAPITPVRMPLDTELATAIHAGTNPTHDKRGVTRPAETPVASNAASQAQAKQRGPGVTKT